MTWLQNRPNPYTTEGAAALALGLLDHLGISGAAFVGHSAGAPIALEASPPTHIHAIESSLERSPG